MSSLVSAWRSTCHGSLNHGDVLERSLWLMAMHGMPGRIRNSSKSDFMAKAMRIWLKHVEVKMLYIPRKPLGKWLHRDLQW